MTVKTAKRMEGIAPFHVMDILAQAKAMEAAGQDIIHMEIGEPDFTSPEPTILEGKEALNNGATHYTPSLGLPELRKAIARYYQVRFHIDIDPECIVVTPGASGALQLVLGTLVNPGDEVLLTDPGYPCNRHMVNLFGGVPQSIPLESGNGFDLNADMVKPRLTDKTKALMVATPSNPTGRVLTKEQLLDIHKVVSADDNRALIVDEIYQGLRYDDHDFTAASFEADNLFVINSFSKYFGMTGWRVGWVIAPKHFVGAMERLAQNIFLAASTLGQHAALAAFNSETTDIIEERRLIFAGRRDFLYQSLTELGFDIAVKPEGAFYLYADISRFSGDSMTFAQQLLQKAGVAVTPGIDFGEHNANRYIRFAYTTGLERLEEAVERIRRFIQTEA